MSNQATESILHKVNRLVGVSDSYQAPEKIMETLRDHARAKEMFFRFLPEFDYDLSYEWFEKYFEDEHADRKNNKQDFTPKSVSKLVAAMLGAEQQKGIIYEPAAGAGSMVITHWYGETRKCRFPWDYNPNEYLYVCEELSNKTLPFLLFNLMIRGINAVVIHGDALTLETKGIYKCENKSGSLMCFSELEADM